MNYLKYLFISLVFVCLNAQANADIENQLKAHPSPYLAMHGNDPVAWQSWGKDVFERAQKEDKLIFVSIGYFSCHWCHVMQRESYKNNEIAVILNKNFIPVKVDRELQPALDARLIEFVERTRGYSGWPLNVFVTPQGHPLVGIVYLPPDNFKQLLQNLVSRWKAEPGPLRQMAEQAADEIEYVEYSLGPDLKAGLGDTYQAALKKGVLKMADTLQGGFGEQNKFPQYPQLSAILDIQVNQPDPALEKFLRLSLDQMASQGLYDQLRGGFYRYAVDPNWQIPHFEKMLYDNALLAELYLKAAKIFKHKPYELTARKTLDFMLNELMSDKEAMSASLSAVDDKGIEGGFYLWDEDTLKRILTEQEYKLIRRVWGMQNAPTLEDGFHPVQAESLESVAVAMGLDSNKANKLFTHARDKMLVEQNNRILPRDDKLLAAWNGLALRALSSGAILESSDRYRHAAKKIRGYIEKNLWDGKQLIRAKTKTGSLGSASLEDYAYVASGLLAWAKLTGDKNDYDLTRAISAQAWSRFYSEKGWSLTEDSLITYGASEPVIADGPMPSPSAVLIEVSLRLAERYNDNAMKKRALSALNVGRKILLSDPFWYASHINVISTYQRGSQTTAN